MYRTRRSFSIERFVRLIEEFTPRHNGADQIWIFFVREKRKWIRLHVQKYREVYYLTTSDFMDITFPDPRYDETTELRNRVKIWIHELSEWQKSLLRDPIDAQSSLFRRMPLSLRSGVMTRNNVRTLLPNWLPIEKQLTTDEKERLLPLLDKPDPEPLAKMTLNRFLEYCRIAYEANAKVLLKFRPGRSGREYYQRYADGRDGGLLKINGESADEFSRWYDGKERLGSHPWEIYRGGNATHIDLSPVKSERGWSIYLSAFSGTRLAETCRIALGLTKASLPFAFSDQESYKLRLLSEDWVGIVPEGSDLIYAWQRFPKGWNVAHAVYASWFFEENPTKRRALRTQLRHLVHWLPEPITNAVRQR